MRINRLELQAFGPFFKREEILFSELYDSSIFLISGKTGSGKTTLFDAICFGLFGETSADREVKNLKSDFALELETYVIIEFELDGIEYVIKRYPGDQRVKTERGSRNLKNQEVIITCEYKTITNVTEAKEFIVNLLGVNAEQFKKIVMLPQGKFKELLFASTSEKGEIFRTIFGTERLSMIMNNIRDKFNDVRRIYADSSRDKDKILSNLECENNNTISEQIELDTTFIKETDLLLNKHSEEVTLLKDKISTANDSNKKILDYNDSLARLTKLENDKELFDNHKLELEKALFAKENKQLYNNVLALKRDIELTKTEIIKNKEVLETSEKKYESIDVTDEDIKNCRETIEKLNITLQELNKINEIFVKIEDVKLKINKKIVAQNELNTSLKLINVSNDDITSSRNKIKLLEEELTKLKNLTTKLAELHKVDDNLKDCLIKCSEYTDKAKQSNDKLYELQNTYNNDLASQLAIDLVTGKPCPVCGSLEHPNIAVPSNSEVTKQMIDKQQLEKEKLSIQLAKYQTNRDNYVLEKTKIEKEIKEIGIEYESDNMIENYVKITKGNLSAENSNLVGIEKSLSDLNEKSKLLSGVNSEINILKENFNDLKGELELINYQKLTYDSTKEATIDTSKDLSGEKNRLETLEKKYKEKTVIHESILKIKSQLKVLENNIHKYNSDLAISQDEFNIILEDKFGNNTNDFIKYLGVDSNSLKNSIDNYNNELTKCRTTISNLSEFKDKIIIDIKVQEDELLMKEAEISKKKQLRDQVYNRNILNTKNIDTLNKLTNEMISLENKYKILEKINDVAQGNYNNEKVNFETRVLAVFYEEVLELTNNKLKLLSKGRYQLKRKVEKSGGGKQGLDTIIFDLSTGKERGISSVSGGESFMISLALALSLSEITQMNTNSVDIETLFIDEGFGTLDPESLEITINLLLELNQDGKLIGIISHVKELQDRISAKIVIESTKKGSYIKDIIY